MDYQRLILIDVATITLLAVALALAVHALLRRRDPEVGFGPQGNVWTSPFDWIDLVVTGFLLVLMFSFIFYGSGAGGSPEESGTDLTVGGAWMSVAINLFILGALLYFVGILGRRNIAEVFGLERYHFWRILRVAVLGIMVTVPLVMAASEIYRKTVLQSVADRLDYQDTVQLLSDTDNTHLKIVMIIAACIVAPLVEEFLFRGYIYAVMKRYTDRFFSAVATSMAFAVIHLNLMHLAPLFVLAMCFTIAYEVTGCLWVPIVMHAVFNTGQVVFILSNPDLL